MKDTTLGSDSPGPDNLPALPMPNYRCRWIKCNSKLHNLATLRGHVFKRHTPDSTDSGEQEFVCWWNRCEYLHFHDSGNVDVTHVFINEQEWKTHIETKHIQPIGRRYGDGQSTNTGESILCNPSLFNKFVERCPCGNLTRTSATADHYKALKVRTRFLSDANGHEATPPLPYDIPHSSENSSRDVLDLTRHYQEGQTSVTGKADVNARRAFLKAHGLRPGDQRSLAEETIRAMVVRKQKIGPGIDRGGCTLINEARRATFVQAPGISRLIDADSDLP